MKKLICSIVVAIVVMLTVSGCRGSDRVGYNVSKEGDNVMLIHGDYCIEYLKSKNRVTIYLPQTAETVQNTNDPIINRKVDITDADLLTILKVAELYFLQEDDE